MKVFFCYLLSICLLQVLFLSKIESFARAFPVYSQIGLVFPAGKSGEFVLNLRLNYLYDFYLGLSHVSYRNLRCSNVTEIMIEG